MTVMGAATARGRLIRAVRAALSVLAACAAVATAGLVLCSGVGYARLGNKSWRDVTPFAAAIVSVPIFFVAIFAAFAPQYLAIFKNVVNR